ncbi:MAG: glucose-1-phosphate adenylyltransferase [Candidatus Lindowbacteria bacterium RIFCSPLOWO2_12_FULL_62_27]|nr:MAG: glucose-1-phosphate adenylyltransferase [Candidatus Lindowbacteria bacterium RIFCSPLOWO2_02_FULL_62_12]OGH63244.1 MAG: glucose-1-phosphate adenylyltransferase [Candidatus Lindowbacteria bacterium RIFCSPLOWO2_12_FULL_62_27]
MKNTLGMILAGGRGTRLGPLVQDRAKPAVPFAGKYRIIDFVLNNFINSGLSKIKVLTQFKADSLIRHIMVAYNLPRSMGMYVDPVPAQMRIGEVWYRGTADAIYQNSNLIVDSGAERVAVFGGDHVYKMDINQMMEFHTSKTADLTIAAIPVRQDQSNQFGIIEVNEDWQIVGFEEKPAEGKTIPSKPGWCLASMGNYIFNSDVLIEELDADAHEDSEHDFGKNIIRAMIPHRRVYAYDFATNRVPGMTDKEIGYWRDVGTVDAYYEANMDVRSVSPVLNLYNVAWPFRTYPIDYPPAKFALDEGPTRRGHAVECLVSEGCIISGAMVLRSILSPGCFVHSYAQVEDSILYDKVDVGRHAKVRRAIVDKGVRIPQGIEIGYNLEEDRKRFFVSESGIIVIPKGAKL